MFAWFRVLRGIGLEAVTKTLEANGVVPVEVPQPTGLCGVLEE